MKIKVAHKREFDKWRHKIIADNPSLSFDVQELLAKSFDSNIREINVSPTIYIQDLLRVLDELLYPTSSDLHDDHDLPDDHHQDFILTSIECLVYCLAVRRGKLDPTKQLRHYGIRENDLILFERFTHSWGMAYLIGSVKGVKDFTDNVLSIDDPRELFSDSIKGILLYTDEDTKLAQYIRCNFSAIDEMTGTLLELYLIERPDQLSNTPASKYWKTKLEQSAYAFLRLMGWTKYKPYSKHEVYRIAHIMDILPDSLPCLVIFRDIKSDEKLIIKVTENFTEFFRRLVSVLKRVQLSMQSYLKEAKEKEIQEILEGINSEIPIFDLSSCDNIADPELRREAKIQLSNKLRSSGCISKTQAKELAEKAYKAKDREGQRKLNEFKEFKQQILNEWRKAQGGTLAEFCSDSQNDNKAGYSFYGNTVFINQPEGAVSINDFQKEGDK